MIRRALRFALASAVAVALLAWLTRGLDWRAVTGALRPAPWWAWAMAVLGLAASYGFRALRIHSELRLRHALGVSDCLEVMLVHNAAVNIVPMRGGEAAYPWYLNRRLGVPVSHALASLVWMRAQDAVVLAFLASALWPGLSVSVRVGAAAALATVVLLGLHVLERLATRADGRLERWPLRSVQAAVKALALAPRHGWEGWVWCVASWTVKLAALGSLLAALSGVERLDAWMGALGGELAGVLPLQGPAGLGTYEAGVWAGAALRGRSAIEVAAPALAVHVVSLVTAVSAGALAHALSRRGPARPSAPMEQGHG